MTQPDGVLLLDKPAGITSHDAVFKIRKLFGTSKVGHTGTLDPMATGLLIVLIGRAAKACDAVTHDVKSYRATLRLGLTADTQDTTGTVLTVNTDRSLPDLKAVGDTVRGFTGPQLQVPPMYSALKVNGRKLCDLARAGITVERQPREITVYGMEVSQTPRQLPSDFTLDVTCSGGTYIRTLCADIGDALGCGAVMASLRRTSVSGFDVRDSLTLEQLGAMTIEQRTAALLPVETLFGDLPSVTLCDFHARLIRNGCAVNLTKLGISYPVGTRLRLYNEAGVFWAVGQVVMNEDAESLKTEKLFVL